MYIPPYYLGLIVGCTLTVASEIAIVLIVDYRNKKRKEKMKDNFLKEEK